MCLHSQGPLHKTLHLDYVFVRARFESLPFAQNLLCSLEHVSPSNSRPMISRPIAPPRVSTVSILHADESTNLGLHKML